MQDIFEDFGHSVRKKRNELGLTQSQLASKLGMCNRTIIQLENGRGNTKFETLVLIAKELNISIDASVFPNSLPNGIPKCVLDYFAEKGEAEAQKYIELCRQADRLKD